MGWWRSGGGDGGPVKPCRSKCCTDLTPKLKPSEIVYLNNHSRKASVKKQSRCGIKFKATCPQPEGRVAPLVMGIAPSKGTTFIKALSIDGISGDFTHSECLQLPLKAGGNFSIAWIRLSGGLPAQMAMQDTWNPAGTSGVFSFLPIVNVFSSASRRRTSDQGSLDYSASDVPQEESPFAAVRTTTYWTEFDQIIGTYFEYFAGSGLATTDPMFGRINRMYDKAGNTLSYSYSANVGGQQLLRKITGLGGNVVPYFTYADETIDATHFAPITKLYLSNIADATQSKTVYFDYSTFNNLPYLTKIVNPTGCTTQFVPYQPFDTYKTFRMGAEVDPDGYATYFNYTGLFLSSTVEPGGRLVYYEYGAFQTKSAEQGQPATFVKYQMGSSGNSTLPTSVTDPMGRTTYFTNDASLASVVTQVSANNNVTYFAWVGGSASSGNNRYALRAITSQFNGAQTYYDYLPGGYTTARKVGPRNIPGVFPVVTYYSYDSAENNTSIVDPLGYTTLFAYDDTGLRLREQDSMGRVTYFNYGIYGIVENSIKNLGLLTEVVDPLGNTTYYGWNDYGDKLWAVSPRGAEPGGLRGFTTYFAYDLIGRPLKSRDPLGNTTYYEWTSVGLLLGQVDSRGIRTDLTYDGRGAVTSTTVHDAGGAVLTQRLYSSDSHLQRVQDQDALGKVTYFAYNANDRLTSVQNALGGLSYFYYDSVDNVTCLVNPRQSATYFFYDPLSRLVAQSDALGNSAYYFYDLADNRTCEVDQRSYGTYYFYDALDRIQVSRNSLSLPTYFFYDLIGNTSVVRDALGNPAYYFYDGRNRRTAVRDAFGSATYFGYDAIGNVKRLVDPRKSVTYFTYDAIDRLQSRLDALGNAGYYYYDGVGNTTALRDPRGNAVYYFYDGLSRLTAQCDSIGNTSYFLYDTVGNLFQSRNARGVTTYFFYDALQRLSVARDGLTNATYFFYDATSNRTHIRDGRGNATYFFYDAVDRPSVARDALGNAGYFFYDAAGNRTCTRDAQGFSAYFSYDQLGRLSVVRGPLDRITYFGYDFIGNMARVIEADTTGSAGYGLQSYGTTLYGGWLPAEESTSYDRIGRATLRQDALGNLSYFFYDAGSNRTAIRDPLAHATYFGYDALDRVTKVQDSLGGTTYFEFDPVGNATKIVDANNRDVQTRYDVLDRPDAIRMADGGSTYFFYDPANNRLREVSPRGNATYYLYDSLNRATGIADALWRSLYFEYDAVGKLSRTVDAEGSAGAHTYDAVSRRTQTNYTPAGAAVAASLRSDPYYVYDEVGNVVQSGDFWGLHRMGYDGLRRQVRHLYPKGQVVYYEYSPRSLVTSIVYPVASGAARMAYDLLRRQTRAASPSGAAAYFSFDAASNLTQRFLGNSAKLDMTYDAADRIARWRGTNKSGGSLSYFDYTRDPKGLVTKLFRESTHTVYYQYDASDRLITEIWSKAGTPEVYGFRYVYDPAGNRTRARINGADTYYFYDEANELRVTGTNSAYATTTYYIYDKNGALTNLVEPSGVTYFAYNAAGLVARMRWKDASATYFFYDGALQRYAMTAGGTTTYFLWNGPNLLQELNADGTVKEEHTNAQTSIGGIGQLVETNRPGQAQPKIYPIMDPRGSITNWIQSDGTTVFAAREYDAFGTIITNSVVGTWPGRFGYQGQAWLEIFSANAAQRLLLSPTRIYDPVTGRFLQNEPLLETRPFTHYLYANQNPLRFVDPLGLAGCGDEPTPGQCENTPLKGFQKAPSGPKIPVLSKYPMVPGQIGWVYYIDANGKLQGTYVGSAESLSRLFNQGHPAEQLIFEPPLDRTITAWRAFGEPNIPWSGQGTSQSALQESLRSVEAPIIRSLSPVESPLSLNAINAARVQNAEVWEAIHQSRLSQRPIRIANPGQGIVLRSLGILGWVQVVADEAVIKPIEEKKAQYVNDLLQFSDDEYADLYGRPQGHDFNILIEPGEHFWNADKYYKSYLSGSCKDKRIYIDKAEAKRILQNYEALYGYVDWKGDFVPGIRRKSLPVLPYRPPIIS